MSEDTARRLLSSAAQAAGESGAIQITFQGGEPTVAGLDFFRRFAQLEREICPPTLRISHSIQTNGMALDEQWATLFREQNYFVGLSLDGTRAVHDLYRVDAGGQGTWDRVVRALALLDRFGVETNLLCVVTAQLARSPQKVYRAMKELGPHGLQFIPCLDPMEETRGSMPYSLTPERYGHFLCGLFDCWYLDWTRGSYVSIRLFDDYLRILAGMPPSTCAATGACGSYLVVEGDGSLYPCDFFVTDRWYLGNLHQMSVSQAMESEKAREFLNRGNCHPERCGECPYAFLCRGGCKRDWIFEASGTENYYCSSFRTLLDYALPRLREAAKVLSR